MANFKILEEATHDYGNQDHLYLMLIQHNQRYFIEVDTRVARVEKRMIPCRKEAEKLFSRIETRMKQFKNIYQAYSVLKLALSHDSTNEMLFLVNNLRKAIDFNEIWKMKLTYGCQTTPVLTDLVFEEKSYNHTIHITFPGRNLPLGYFKAKDENSKFIFFLRENPF